MNCEKMKQLGIDEVFLPIDGFPNYEVSNYGNVRNIKKNIILKPYLREGYGVVDLFFHGKNRSPTLVHRLVITTFENNNDHKPFVDHIDNNKSNNCLFNLRFVTYRENNFNKSMRSDNSSGIKGISWRKDLNKWRAYININNKRIYLGSFDDINDAKKARQKKARELFGEYINKCEL
jgi:hypothetical protein